jgi:hypothetical protein
MSAWLYLLVFGLAVADGSCMTVIANPTHYCVQNMVDADGILLNTSMV